MSRAKKSQASPFANGRLPILSKRTAFIALALTSVFAVFGISRIELNKDITALLPSENRDSIGLTKVARQAGLMKKVILLLGPSIGPLSERAEAMDAVTAQISRVDGVASVWSRVDETQLRSAASSILSNSWRLRGPNPAVLTGKEIAKRLTDLKKQLATVEAMVMGTHLLKDPLGFSRTALRHLETAAHAMGTLQGGRLVSKDGRYHLAVITTSFDPMDVSRAKRFVADLEDGIAKGLQESKQPTLGAVHIGGPHFAASSATAVISDVKRAFVLTAILVVAVFLVFFRSVRLIPAALLPGAVGIAVAAAVMGILKIPLHALTLGFAATITGISIDYAIHLLKRTMREDGRSENRVQGALGKTVRPITLGCLTTTGAFALIATSGFTGIRQMAIFASISIPTAMLATLFVLPAFHGFLLGTQKSIAGRDPGGERRVSTHELGGPARVGLWAAFSLILILSVWGASRVTLSGDPRDMQNQDPDLKAREQTLRSVFPGLSNQALLVSFGPTLEQALQINDALYDKLLERGIDPGRIVSISPFLPSLKTQQQSLASVKSLLAGSHQTPPLRTFLNDAGFKSEYVSDLEKMLDSDPLTPASYAETGLETILGDAVSRGGGVHSVITRIGTAEGNDISRLAGIVDEMDGCRLASERLEIERALTQLQREMVWMLAIWLGVALTALTASQRSLRFGLLAALPAMIGVTAALSWFGFTGRPLTPVASAGVTLVLGLGIDYGIFMQLNRSDKAGVAGAVIASALTTLAGFGVLSLSETRAMADLGLIILVGVIFALLTAIGLLPTLSPRRQRNQP